MHSFASCALERESLEATLGKPSTQQPNMNCIAEAFLSRLILLAVLVGGGALSSLGERKLSLGHDLHASEILRAMVSAWQFDAMEMFTYQEHVLTYHWG